MERIRHISPNMTEFTYHKNGNMTEIINPSPEDGESLKYSVDDRLMEYEKGAVSADYFYDVNGLRVKKQVGDNKSYYLYDGSVLLGEVTKDKDGVVTDDRYYIFNPGGYYPLALVDNEGADAVVYDYHNDHLMTPLKLTDEGQDVDWDGDYSAFGQVSVASSGLVNNLRFPGQFAGLESSMYHNVNRYYEAGLGRYTRIDPISYSIILGQNSFPYKYFSSTGDFKKFYLNQYLPMETFILILSLSNSYLYSKNNSILYFDPFGLYTTCNVRCNMFYGALLISLGIGLAMTGVGAIGLAVVALVGLPTVYFGCEYGCRKMCEHLKNTGRCSPECNDW